MNFVWHSLVIVALFSGGSESLRPNLLWSGSKTIPETKCPPSEELLPCICELKINEIHIRCENSDIGRVGAVLELLKKEKLPVEELFLVANRIPSIPARFFGSLQVKKLYLIDNDLVGISRNAFAGLEGSVEQIYLHESILQELPFDTFDNLRLLRSLVLEDTAVTDIPRLFSLPQLELFKIDHSRVFAIRPGVFTRMPSMKKIQISNSDLNNLIENAMEGLIYLKSIDFSNNNISWVHPGAFRTLETVEELNLSGNKIEDGATAIIAARELRSLRVLDISKNNLRQLTQGTLFDMANLEKVKLSENMIKEIHPEAMFKLPMLKHLDLSRNQLIHFEANIFTDVPSLEYLSLARNNLSFILDMRFIYQSLPNLRTLDLSANYFRASNAISFGGHSKLERLILSYNFITQLSKDLFRDLPNLQELYLNHNLINNVIENQIWKLPMLRILDISHNDLGKIEPGIFEGLINLNELELSFNLLSEVSVKTFDRLTHLKYLNMSYNKITKLLPRTFNQSSELYELDISYNGITTFELGLLDGLASLEFLHSSNNQLMTVNGPAFKDTAKLKYLDLSGNLIRSIPTDALRRLPSLRTLNLRKNAVNSVPGGSFAQLRVIESLDLSHNHIQYLDSSAFNEMNVIKNLDISVNYIQNLGSDSFNKIKLIEKLNISNNFITEIGRNTFLNLKRLRILDLTNNSLTTIGESLQNLPSLQGLFMSYNYINTLTNASFINLPSLNVLFFSNNGLQTFEVGTFYNLSALMHLNLKNNNLVELKSYSFSSMSSLKELKLSQNQISLIEDYAFINLPALQSLELQDNVITHISDNAFDMLPILKFLNLSRNGLQEIPEKALARIPTLDVLDISWNYIMEVRDSSFENLRWLTVLMLHHNELCHLSGSAFKGPKSLRVLMLYNNQMKRLHLSALQDPIGSLSILDMSGNPFECDCELTWLREYLQEDDGQFSRRYYQNVENHFRGSAFYGQSYGRSLFPNFPSTMHGEPVCAGPPQYEGKTITEVPPEAFLCNSFVDAKEEQCLPPFINPSIFSVANGGQGLSPEVVNTLLRLSNLTEILPGDIDTPSYLDYKNPILVSGIPGLQNLSSLFANSNDRISLVAETSKPSETSSGAKQGSAKNQTTSLQSDNLVPGDTPTIYAGPSANKSSSHMPEDPKNSEGGIFGFKLPNLLSSLGKLKLPNLGFNLDWAGLPFGRVEEGLPHPKPSRGPDDSNWVRSPPLHPNSLSSSVIPGGKLPYYSKTSSRGNNSASPKLYPLFSDFLTIADTISLNSTKDTQNINQVLKGVLPFQHPKGAFGPGPNAGTPFLPGLLKGNPVTLHQLDKAKWSLPEEINPAVPLYPPTSSFRPIKTYDQNNPIFVVEGPNAATESGELDPYAFTKESSSDNPLSQISNRISSTTADVLSSDLRIFDQGNKITMTTNKSPESTKVANDENHQGSKKPGSKVNRVVGSVHEADLGDHGKRKQQKIFSQNSEGVGGGRERVDFVVIDQPVETSTSLYDDWTKSFVVEDNSQFTIPTLNVTPDLNDDQEKSNPRKRINQLGEYFGQNSHHSNIGTRIFEANHEVPWQNLESNGSTQGIHFDTRPANSPTDSSWWPPSPDGSRAGTVQAVTKNGAHIHGTRQVSPSRSVGKFTATSSVEKVDQPFLQGIDLPQQFEELLEKPAVEITEPTTANQEGEPKKEAGNMEWYFSNYYREYNKDNPLPIGGNGPPKSAARQTGYPATVTLLLLIFQAVNLLIVS